MKHAFADEEPLELPMTSLIDVVFLLLIFFLVATNFVKKEVDQQVKLPETGQDNGTGKESAQPFIVNVRADGSLIVNGKWTQEDELRVIAREWVATHADPSGNAAFELRGDGRVPYENIMHVMTICEEAGLKEVGLTRIAKR